MGNGVSTDQGNFHTHGIRDVRRAADRKQHDWSPLAEASITKQPNLLIATANSYNSIGLLVLRVQEKKEATNL